MPAHPPDADADTFHIAQAQEVIRRFLPSPRRPHRPSSLLPPPPSTRTASPASHPSPRPTRSRPMSASAVAAPARTRCRSGCRPPASPSPPLRLPTAPPAPATDHTASTRTPPSAPSHTHRSLSLSLPAAQVCALHLSLLPACPRRVNVRKSRARKTDLRISSKWNLTSFARRNLKKSRCCGAACDRIDTHPSPPPAHTHTSPYPYSYPAC